MCEINPIRSDSVEINCQEIYDNIIECQRIFDGNPVFEKNLSDVLNEIEELLYQVNDVDIFAQMVDLIFRFKYRLRQLEDQMKYIDDERIENSRNIAYIMTEMQKFKEII